jgi:hypothetical protein
MVWASGMVETMSTPDPESISHVDEPVLERIADETNEAVWYAVAEKPLIVAVIVGAAVAAGVWFGTPGWIAVGAVFLIAATIYGLVNYFAHRGEIAEQHRTREDAAEAFGGKLDRHDN